MPAVIVVDSHSIPLMLRQIGEADSDPAIVRAQRRYSRHLAKLQAKIKPEVILDILSVLQAGSLEEAA